MADYGGSTTNPETRDRTQTPKWLFRAMDREFEFKMDAACLDETTLVPGCYLTPAEDSLSVNWSAHLEKMFNENGYDGEKTVWLNPPYSNILPWVLKANQESSRGVTTVMLVPMDATAVWWPIMQQPEVRIITGYVDAGGRWRSGRINFIDTETGEEIRGNPKGSCFLIFHDRTQDTVLNDFRTTYVSKGDLIARAEAHVAVEQPGWDDLI